MNYVQTVNYLFEQLPMFSRVGSMAIKEGLTNTILICNQLHNPQHKFKSIHVAGTNGKGSVSHMLAAILQTAGYKTGLYTSPHLTDFRERIKVNGIMCSEEFVIEFTTNMRGFIENNKPSFFEITVAMAFKYFEQENVDIAIIETGLGGRLDSTNIITPILSVITNIGLDHVQILGNSLQEIAVEKAGIIKPNIPIIIGEAIKETEQIFKNKANDCNANIYFAQKQFTITSYKHLQNTLEVFVSGFYNSNLTILLDLPGIYQLNNLITVLSAVKELIKQNFKIDELHLLNALKQVKQLTGLKGRWQLLKTNPTVIADVAHNVNGIEKVIEHLQNLQYNQLHIITGMVKDKDVRAALALLPKYAIYYFTQANIPRAMQADELKQIANQFNLKGAVFSNVNFAIETALSEAKENDLILILGSVFLVGEINTM